MANIQIPNLPAAINLNGLEQLEIVQDGVSRRTTTLDIANLTNLSPMQAQIAALRLRQLSEPGNDSAGNGVD